MKIPNMKIPKYAREPTWHYNRGGLQLAAKALRIEAKISRKQRVNAEFSRALDYAAHCLEEAAQPDVSLATAFDWPSDSAGDHT